MVDSDFGPEMPGKLVPFSMQESPDGPLSAPVQTKTIAFVPNPLPPDIDWDTLRLRHFQLYSDTVSAL